MSNNNNSKTKAIIEFEDDNADVAENLMIKLYTLKYESYPKNIQKAIDNFISILCSLIGAKTDVNYHAYTGAQNGYIFINIYMYNESFNTTLELAQHRLNTVVKYLEHLDLTKQQAYITKLLNILLHHDINLNDFLYASVVNRVDESIYIPAVPIHMKHPTNYKRVKVYRQKLNDGSSITIINDKCATNYGIFVNLSVTFDEMGMSYNALHLYEHLMMKCFYDLPEEGIDDENGSTYPNGLCFVYTTHKNIDSFKMYINKCIGTLLQSRDIDYWNKPEQEQRIAFETKRTISETRHTRTLIDFGRSDLHAYNDNGYDKNIFTYWSNKPFNVVITGNNIDTSIINLENIQKFANEHPIHNVPRPANVKYNRMPIDVLTNKEFMSTLTKKCDKDYIKKLFSNPSKDKKLNVQSFLKNGLIDYGPYGYLYGLDCKVISLRESLATYNTFMLPIVFFNQFYSETELEQLLNLSNLPCSANNYGTTKYFE